ncbi:hypothetical protein JIN84_06735 [Luteolibacter yonseiensis]|uniref:YbgF trimerisation domain-containing protein n=1 Tax=Luteolibacter yonseiensis TaxID=1144680 RepID=A0A934VAW0_9BACT|nr:hypothetical protein [Luteolibacter yonseiensis]MBK1815301.1 hypothetical protein [Luteolibacter yonseiensis]
MNPATVPILCGAALAAISAAGASHWWSVNSFIAATHGKPAIRTSPSPAVEPVAPASPAAIARHNGAPPADDSQKRFFETLVKRMENLQNQNRDLLDQMAETNRDVMKLEFRVDTHSESFRPMPVSDDRPDMSLDNSPGVLPPRAEIVFPPSDE